MQTVTSRLGAFVRSLALLGVFSAAFPWALITAADARFGGTAPWSAMPAPADWSADATWSVLTGRLSETTIADIVIRVGLAVAWVAITVLLVTIVAEGAHMVRHDGLAMPLIRGLGTTQRTARVIAAGLLVIVPMISSPNRAIARDSPLLEPTDHSAAAVEHGSARPENAWIGSAHTSGASGGTTSAPRAFAPSGSPGAGRARAQRAQRAPAAEPAAVSDTSAAAGGDYVVRAGDSVYAIAARMAGPEQGAIIRYADRLLELNLGRQMADGQWFTNAAYIDVDWVLHLPPVATESGSASVEDGASSTDVGPVEVVDRGESLWSIAEDRLGAGRRWSEIYELNEGRTFGDGRDLDDPNRIHPGWELALPTDAVDEVASPPATAEPATPEPSSHEPVTRESAQPAAPDDMGSDHTDRTTDRPGATVRPENAWLAGHSASISSPRPDGALGGDPSSRVPSPPADSDAGHGLAPTPDGERAVGEGGHAGDDDAPHTNVDPDIDSPVDTGEVADTAGTVDIDGTVDDVGTVQLLTFERAAMLSAGVLALLAVRRRTRMRRARPNSRLPEPAAAAVATERSLRSIDAGGRFARVDIGIRSAAAGLVDQQTRVVAVVVDTDGDLELHASGPVELRPPWEPAGDGVPPRWRLPASTPTELLADEARRVGAPCPTLVQLGRDVDGRDVYVDLEALEALEVGGPGDQADSVVTAVAATLAASVLAEVTTLVGVAIDHDAFLDHRLHRPVRDIQCAFEAAREAIGSTATADCSTFELRARVTSGEAWEPAVVLAGSAAGTVVPPRNRTGLAVVSASPIHGPSSLLTPDGDAWTLLPLGLRLTPVGLSDRDVAAIAALTSVPEPEPVPVVDLVDGAATHRGRSDPDSARVASSSEARSPDDPNVTLLGGVDDVLAGDLDASREAENAIVDDRDPGGDDVGGPSEKVSLGGPRDDASESTSVEDGDRGGGGGGAGPVSIGVADVAGRGVAPLPHSLVVRLLGAVSVEAVDGRAVEFERSKTKELVAWLATHRDRATRSNARAALWELDVRDSTFANVVSEARRALARLVEPPEGDEWVGRTMTDALPLHPLVVTDLDLVEHALGVARLQPPDLAIETLTPAVEWVVGVPFEGTSYLWPDAEGITSELVLRAITVTNALAAHCLSVGDIDGVFAASGRGLQVLPAHEDMIAVRMRAYAHVGDRAGIRHEWETYERAIVADPWSDGEPSSRMLRLRRELLST